MHDSLCGFCSGSEKGCGSGSNGARMGQMEDRCFGASRYYRNLLYRIFIPLYQFLLTLLNRYSAYDALHKVLFSELEVGKNICLYLRYNRLFFKGRREGKGK
jgi:hypothetical protein